jgi:hypothetical protein
MKTIPEQLTSAKRELAYRRNLYPKWLAAGKITQAVAAHEIECFVAIICNLEKLKMLHDISNEMKGVK